MSASSKGKEGRPYDPPYRTKAYPPHTLFGAEMQHFTEAEKQAMKDMDLARYKADKEKERRLQQQRYKKKLPSYLKESLPG